MPLSRRVKYVTHKKRSKRRKIIFVSFVFGFLLVFFGYFVVKQSNWFKKDSQAISADAKVEVPATPTAPAETVKVKSTDEVISQIETFLQGQAGEYAYKVTELDTGRTYGARFNNSYTAASTIKVAVATYLEKQIELGKVNPDKYLTYTSADYEGGTGILVANKFGSTYKISYLCEVMLSKSDNVATNILLRYLGISNIQNFLNSNGLSGIVMSTNTATPASMNQLLVLIEARQIVNEVSAADILGHMTNSLNSSRIVGGVPSGVRIAHKIGTAAGALSDVGIVYFGTKKYVICVYSKKVIGESTPESVIRNISKMVYSFESTR